MLISIRDPVERVLSAFKWRNQWYQGGRGVNTSTWQQPYDPIEGEFYSCFPNTATFIQSFSKPRDSFDSKCHPFLYDISRAPRHIGMGYFYHLQYVLDIIFDDGLDLFVFRVEHRAKDILGFESWLQRHIKPGYLRNEHADYPGRRETPNCSTDEMQVFKKYLKQEYDIYNRIIERATNIFQVQ